MIRNKIKKKLTAQQAERIFAFLGDESPEPMGEHLTDMQFGEYGTEALTPAETQDRDRHLSSCERCAGEMARRVKEATYWDTPEGLAQMKKGQGELLRVASKRADREPGALIFGMRGRSVVLLNDRGLGVRSDRKERERLSLLRQDCRSTARDPFGFRLGIAANAMRSGSNNGKEIPAANRSSEDDDALSADAAFATRSGNGYSATVVVSSDDQVYDLEVLLEDGRGRPVTEGKVSWRLRDGKLADSVLSAKRKLKAAQRSKVRIRDSGSSVDGSEDPNTIDVKTGEVWITKCTAGIVDLSIAVRNNPPLQLVVNLLNAGSPH